MISNGMTDTQTEIDARLTDFNTVTDGTFGLPLVVHPETHHIGDVIHSKGVCLQFHLELDPHQSQCIFKICVVKSSKGDLPTNGTTVNKIYSVTQV